MAYVITQTMNTMGNTATKREFFVSLGSRIAQLRKEARLTQVQLAHTLDVAQPTLNAYELGQRRVPVSALPVLAKALGVTLETLIGEADAGTRKRGLAPKLQHHVERINQLRCAPFSSRRVEDFKRNPQQFIELAAEAINRCKRLAVVDGIKYQRLGDEHYYAQELFEKEELTGYLKNMLNAEKAVHEQVIYDSGTEAAFADELEKNVAIKVYAKLPGWFVVPTPLGNYN